MAYIKNGLSVGDDIILNKDYSSCAGTFEKGTKVTITQCGDRGFSVKDSEGNTMCEMGFDIGQKA